MSISLKGKTGRDPRAPEDAVGLRLIVGYKLLKASAECLFAGLMLVLGTTHVTADLRAIALSMQHHATEAWSLALAGRLVQAATRRNVVVVVIAAFLDGLLSYAEGWVLHRRYRWSRWLVVGTTVSFLPFEVVELARRLSAGRVVLLIVNVLIVVYLLRHRVAASHEAR
jgi:uncharacterized membrane protein (DUF2068 family)